MRLASIFGISVASLGQGLGDACTPPVEAAWTEAYMVLPTVMKDADAE
jgi:hemoglobin-like flavoprotein